MGKAFRITFIIAVVLVVSGGLVMAGIWIGQRDVYAYGWSHSSPRMMNRNTYPGRGYSDFGPGMLGGYGPSGANVTPLTVDQAYQSAEQYLAALNNQDLKIAEVMIFDNNAYVRVVEQSTGIGAFELLVDPVSKTAYPEYGPNMMWNLKYGMMGSWRMMGKGGGMMGGYGSIATPSAVSAGMNVTPDQALTTAQTYLKTNQPGTTTAPDADTFYGYYTIDILKDGKTLGMLSVNGFDGQVFMHTWHGTFIEKTEY
jgi:hypothetical protein